MYKFYESFDTAKDNGQPYSIEVEKNSRFAHDFGYVKDGAYVINCTGGRHVLNTPALKNFELCVNMSLIDPMMGAVQYGVHFGYDKAARKGKLILLAYNEALSQLLFTLYSVDSEIFTRISETKTVDIKIEPDKKYPFTVKVEDGVCRASFGDAVASFECESNAGAIALMKYKGGAGIALFDVSVCSDDPVEKKTVSKKEYVIPAYDGGKDDHVIELSVYEYEGGLKEISVALSGGVEFTVPYPKDWRLWTSCIEFFKKPYVRFIGECEAEKYALAEQLNFIDSVNANSATIGRLNKVAPHATKENPYSKSFFTYNHSSYKYFVFGYEDFRVTMYEVQGDRSEFVFDENGTLVYYGRPLGDEVTVDVMSEKTEIEKRIEASDFGKKDDALFFIRNNHFFQTSENPIFNVRIMCQKDARCLRYEYALENTYFKKISDITPTEVTARVNEFGLNEINARLILDKLPQKIYHLRVRVYYGDELLYEHESAFDVLDPALKETPAESSGLPFLHSGDAILMGPHPWVRKPDCSLIHYFDSIVCEPSLVEELKTWELLDIYRKKHCIWLTARTVGNKDFFEFEEAMKHGDYINLGFPGIEDSGNYYRYDHFHHILFQAKKLRERYNEFVKLHPEYNLNEANLAERNIPIEDLHALTPYFDEWVDFANEMVDALFREQWEKIKKINPNAKRYAYGPFNIYATESVGAEVMKYFGYNYKTVADRFDGFMEFEDYTFCCDYPLAYSSWCMATNKTLAPNLQISPEVYDSFGLGCPDGHVAYPRPPFSESYAPPYQTVSQIFAYLYNSVTYNGKSFSYFNDNRFMFLTFYNLEPQKRLSTFVKSWGVYLDNKPIRPKKTVCYLYKFSEKDSRFALENPKVTTERPRSNMERCFLYNKSTSAMCYLYEKISEAGLPSGFLASSLEGLSSKDVEVLVIPSVYALTKEDVEAVKKLHAGGTKLIATGDVGELEELFGVVRCEENAYVDAVILGEKCENVLPVTTSFTYKSNGANALLKTNGDGRVAVFEHHGNILLNVDLCEVGAEEFAPLCSIGGRVNVSHLVEEALTGAVKNIFNPVVSADKNCYVNVFESENGDDEINLYDNTPYYKTDALENKITVNINTDCYVDVVPVMDETRKINKLYSNGVLCGFTVVLNRKETQIFKLIKKA